MIYLHHDMYSNFTNGVKSEDLNMTTSILNNELSDLVVYNTKELVSALNKADITAKERWSDEELIDAILQNFQSNPKIVRVISFLIAENNKLINKSGQSEADSLKIVNDISNGLSKISKKIGTDSSLKVSMKKDMMEQVVAKANAKGDYPRTIWKSSKSKLRFFLIAGGIVVVGGLIIYGVYKYRQSRQIVSLETGGGLAGSSPAIVPDTTALPQAGVQPLNNITPPIQMNSPSMSPTV